MLPPSYYDDIGYGPRAPGAVPAARVCSWVCSPERLQGAACLLECWGGTGRKAENIFWCWPVVSSAEGLGLSPTVTQLGAGSW